jgi:valyl-tRNA synthetase
MTHSETFTRSVIEFIRVVRWFRQEMGLSPKRPLAITWVSEKICYEDLMLLGNEQLVAATVNVTLTIGFPGEPRPADAFALPLWQQTVALVHVDPEEFPKLVETTGKRLTALSKEREKVRKIVNAPGFTSAPIEVVDANRRALEDLNQRWNTIFPLFRHAALYLWEHTRYPYQYRWGSSSEPTE